MTRGCVSDKKVVRGASNHEVPVLSLRLDICCGSPLLDSAEALRVDAHFLQSSMYETFSVGFIRMLNKFSQTLNTRLLVFGPPHQY